VIKAVLRGEQDAVAARSIPIDVLHYVRDVINEVSSVAEDVFKDGVQSLRTEDFLNPADFYTVMAPTLSLGNEFVLYVAWAHDEDPLFAQVSGAKTWMRGRGLPGMIVTRRYPTDKMVRLLNFAGNEPHIQLVLWRSEEGKLSLIHALQRVAAE
jgi:hypothetical protein